MSIPQGGARPVSARRGAATELGAIRRFFGRLP